MMVYRMQDANGRGPFKPGFTRFWVDPSRTEWLPSIFDDFPELRFDKMGGYYGCGCEDMDMLDRWFLPSEREILRAAGYSLVAVDADEILYRSPSQVIFWRKKPLNDGIKVL